MEGFTGSIDELLATNVLRLVSSSERAFDGDLTTGEESFAAYVEGRLVFGKLEVIGGIRGERIESEATSLSAPILRGTDGAFADLSEFSDFRTLSNEQTDILPRVLVNYRFTEDTILRGGYYTTVSRPQLSNINRIASFFLDLRPFGGPDNNQPTLRVSQGNPDLEPATTHNFSIDWEHYTNDVGVLKVSVFYKLIEDPLQGSFAIGDLEVLPSDLVFPNIPEFQEDLPANVFVNVTQPVNGDDNNEIWGIELTAERQLDFLPGVFDGLGVYANYTYTDSSGTQRIQSAFAPEGFFEITDVPFEGSPENQETIGLTYNKHGVDASLYYSAQDRRLVEYRPFGLNLYNEAFTSLDFRADYLRNIGGTDVRFFVRGENLLKGDDDPLLETSIGGEAGVPTFITGGTYFGGRSLFIGTSVSF